MSLTNHILIHGDARDLSLIEDESVHIIVTSPPYWQLKDYGTTVEQGQIGFYDTYEQYINNLNLVWLECFRVLHKGCRLCINIGDQFARAVYYGRYKVISIKTEIIRFCEYIGFDFMGSIVWKKVTTTNTTGGAVIMGSFPYPRNGILKINYEHILLFKKLGKGPKVTKEQKEQSKLTHEEWNTYFSGHWDFPGEKQVNHLAAFPIELPLRLIKMFSFIGETVLDPFLGSGTTSIAALITHRNSIGIEINSEYLERAMKRIQSQSQNLWSENIKLEFKRNLSNLNKYSQMIQKLPYLYNNKNKLKQIINPYEKQFGSKIAEKRDNS